MLKPRVACGIIFVELNQVDCVENSSTMIGKLKYLNLLVLLTFLVGQVQYVYGFYFCTMDKATVSASNAEMKTDNCTEDACGECSAKVQSVSSASQELKSDCMQLHVEKKSVVDNFTSSQKLSPHFIQFTLIGNQAESVSNQLFTLHHSLFTSTDPPPLDLPTVNSNLRI
jgi:hypothetical protein